MELNEKFGLASILKELEDAVVNGNRVPLTNKVMVNEDAIINCVDKIYAALPDDIKSAQRVLEQSDKLLESVEGQGQRIIADAKEQADLMTRESAVYQEAVAQAEALVNKAEEAATQLRRDSIHYCDDVLSQLETTLDKMLASIRHNREDLHKFSLYEDEDAADE